MGSLVYDNISEDNLRKLSTNTQECPLSINFTQGVRTLKGMQEVTNRTPLFFLA